MSGVGFLILFGFNCMLFLCEGRIISPSDGTKYIFVPGKTGKIKWEFDDLMPFVLFRDWFFTSGDGSPRERLASIFKNGSIDIEAKLIEVDIERPATLVLKNVNQSYNGVYQFSLTATGPFKSDVTVYIAKKPNVILSCSSTVLNERGDFTCVCKGKDGNPPANVTWYKDGKQFGETKKENNTLTLSNVTKADKGSYTCVARSHIGDEFMDNKTFTVHVRFQLNTKITFGPGCEILGNRSCIVTCVSSGFPVSNHTISHNGVVVSNAKTYTIDVVKYSDAGIYKCFVISPLGNDSDSANLTVKKKPNVTLSCPSYNEVNESNDFTCGCRDNDGNPPSDVTWYKDGHMFGETKKENNTLTLSNVDETNSGNYKCEARNHPGDEFVDAESIVVQVLFQPTTKITFKRGCDLLGGPCIVTCESSGFPAPSHTISHNGTVVNTTKTYTIDVVKYCDAGLYECVAKNVLGNDSTFANLTIKVKPNAKITFGPGCEILGNRSCIVTCDSTGFPLPNHIISHNGVVVSNTKTYALDVVKHSDAGLYKCFVINPLGNYSASANLTVEDDKNEDADDNLEVWHIVVLSLFAFTIIILFFYIVLRYRCVTIREPERNTEPQKDRVDATFEEFDLTEMSKEDNYQSLRGNAAASATNDAAND